MSTLQASVDAAQGGSVDLPALQERALGQAESSGEEMTKIIPINEMTLSDYFAGLAMEGMNASPELLKVVTQEAIKKGDAFKLMAQRAYEIADALMAERSRLLEIEQNKRLEK